GRPNKVRWPQSLHSKCSQGPSQIHWGGIGIGRSGVIGIQMRPVHLNIPTGAKKIAQAHVKGRTKAWPDGLITPVRSRKRKRVNKRRIHKIAAGRLQKEQCGAGLKSGWRLQQANSEVAQWVVE